MHWRLRHGVISTNVPQGLKPGSSGGVYGTTEVVPFRRTRLQGIRGCVEGRHAPGAKALFRSAIRMPRLKPWLT